MTPIYEDLSMSLVSEVMLVNPAFEAKATGKSFVFFCLILGW